MSFTINAELASVYLVAVILLGGALMYIMVHATNYFTSAFRKYDDLNESVQENVSAIRVVKAYVREKFEGEKFRKASENVRQLLMRAELILAWNAPLMMLAVYGCILVISWLGARLIVLSGSTSFTTGDLMSMLSYCMNILMSLMMLSMVFVMITMSAASAKRVAEVLDEKSDLANGENPVMRRVKMAPSSSTNVSFAYKKNGEKALENINLDIKSGETIGIIGGTGSAKSSLVQLLPRLYDVTEGSVEVGGVDVRKYDLETLRNSVAMVLQKNELFSGTIAENLRWGNPDATDAEIEEACKQACADEFIERFPDRYETYIEGGTNVSGGQKQRLCIARALLKKPKILILDDSTSAVDTATDAKIRHSFAEKIPGTTVFIIAQRISSVENADYVLVLDNGHISGFDTPENLLKTNAIYQRKSTTARPKAPATSTRKGARRNGTAGKIGGPRPQPRPAPQGGKTPARSSNASLPMSCTSISSRSLRCSAASLSASLPGAGHAVHEDADRRLHHPPCCWKRAATSPA